MRYGGGVIVGMKIILFFFHVSDHIDHFKEIQKSQQQKTEIVLFWSTPPQFGKIPNYFRFFHLKASLSIF